MAVREEEAKLRNNLANIRHKLLVFSGRGFKHDSLQMILLDERKLKGGK